jgi:hypothetical protein
VMRLFMLSALLLAACNVQAQQTNVHVGGVLQAATGFSGVVVGGTAGVDVRAGRNAFSIDGDLVRVEKEPGGVGYQAGGRQVVRFGLLRPQVFIQVGAFESHYSLTRWKKTTAGPLIGVGYQKSDFVLAVSYEHDLTSENKQRRVSLSMQWYEKRHMYMRTAVTFGSFINEKNHDALFSTRFDLGFHF